MQRTLETTRPRVGRVAQRPFGIALALALIAMPSAAAAWTPWGAIARLFARGDSMRQTDGAAALRALCTQANDQVEQMLATQRGFSTKSSDWLDIAPVFGGSAALAMAFGGGDARSPVQMELANAAEAAMPRVHDFLESEIAHHDFGDPLAVLRSEQGAATRILEVRWRAAVQEMFRERMANDLNASPAWARTEAALDRVGPGRTSRSTQRALLETASGAAADAVFNAMRAEEINLRRNPDLVGSPKARVVLRRIPGVST